VIEVFASVPVRNLLGGAFVGGGTDMPQFGDVVRRGIVHAELRQKLVIVDVIGDAERSRRRTALDMMSVLTGSISQKTFEASGASGGGLFFDGSHCDKSIAARPKARIAMQAPRM
jgi:hypothetical protein